jgi:AcrR family transcriptional regulator
VSLVADAPLPRGRAALPAEVVRASQRRRLFQAITKLTSEKGLVELTVADLVSRAGVARRTFYEFWDDKVDCYLEAYAKNKASLLTVTQTGMRSVDDPALGLVEGMLAYLRALDESPVHARAYLLEALRGGARVLAARAAVHEEFVDLYYRQYQRALQHHPELPALSRNAVTGMIGGVNELVFQELSKGIDDAAVLALKPDVVHLTVAVLDLRSTVTVALAH